MKNLLCRAGISTRTFGFLDSPSTNTELSSQLGLVASLIQFKCTKCFSDDQRLLLKTRSVSVPFILSHPQRYENYRATIILIIGDSSSNPARENEFFSVLCTDSQININLVFHKVYDKETQRKRG